MFEDFAASHRSKINTQLHAIFRTELNAAKDSSQAYYDLLKQLDVLLRRGGKRLRPLLFLIAYQGFGGRDKQASLKVAASQELLHTFLLIHDDVIDRDFHRWGGKNITGVYFERYSKTMAPRDAMHFAQSQALLAGDACFSLANQLLLTSGFDSLRTVSATQLQQRTVTQVVAAEVTETDYLNTVKFPKDEQILQLYRDKTASYSFALPLQLGALFAGADSSELLVLSEIANDLGVAFQLQDDLLGIFGHEDKMGKSNLSDLREGKRTALILKTLELAKPPDQKKLLSILGDQNVDTADLKQARIIITTSGAKEYSSNQVWQYSQRAMDKISDSSLSQPAQELLHDLIKILIRREY
ncbi:polyprenyl synthetase family protein [soil metagenome]